MKERKSARRKKRKTDIVLHRGEKIAPKQQEEREIDHLPPEKGRLLNMPLKRGRIKRGLA